MTAPDGGQPPSPSSNAENLSANSKYILDRLAAFEQHIDIYMSRMMRRITQMEHDQQAIAMAIRALEAKK